ncbi:MAG: hypothetical protein ACLUHE_13545 [Christensenellales bacterium]
MAVTLLRVDQQFTRIRAGVALARKLAIDERPQTRGGWHLRRRQ